MNNSAAKVGEIFREAGTAFNKLSEMTLMFEPTEDSPTGGKWSEEEVEMLRGCVNRFAVELNKISAHIKHRTIQLKRLETDSVMHNAHHTIDTQQLDLQQEQQVQLSWGSIKIIPKKDQENEMRQQNIIEFDDTEETQEEFRKNIQALIESLETRSEPNVTEDVSVRDQQSDAPQQLNQHFISAVNDQPEAAPAPKLGAFSAIFKNTSVHRPKRHPNMKIEKSPIFNNDEPKIKDVVFPSPLSPLKKYVDYNPVKRTVVAHAHKNDAPSNFFLKFNLREELWEETDDLGERFQKAKRVSQAKARGTSKSQRRPVFRPTNRTISPTKSFQTRNRSRDTTYQEEKVTVTTSGPVTRSHTRRLRTD